MSSIASSSGGFAARTTTKICWRCTGPPKKSMSARLRSFSTSGNTRESGIVVGLFTMRPTGPLPAWLVTTTTASRKFRSGSSLRATRKIDAGDFCWAAATAQPNARIAINVRIAPF